MKSPIQWKVLGSWFLYVVGWLFITWSLSQILFSPPPVWLTETMQDDVIVFMHWITDNRLVIWLAAIIPASMITYVVLAFTTWVILLLWVLLGDASSFHKTQVQRYKSVWVAFCTVLLTLFVALFIYYGQVDVRIQALRGEAVLLANLISSDTSNDKPPVSLEALASQAISDVNAITDTYAISDTNAISVSIEVSQLVELTNLADRTTVRLVEIGRTIPVTRGISFEPLQPIMQELVTTTRLISQTFGALQRSSMTNTHQLSLQKELRGKLLHHLEQMRILIASAKTTVHAGSVALSNIFILIATLYMILVLFPWLLLFLFLFRNLDYQVNTKLETLKTLGLVGEFIKKSKGKPLFNVECDFDKPQDTKNLTMPEGVIRDFKDLGEDFAPESTAENIQEGVWMTVGADRKYIILRENQKLAVYDLNSVIAEQAFRNREYVVGLLLLTSITAVMWYFVWYPVGWSGLAQMFTQGESVKALTDYLINDASALTYGFLGAYIFVIHQLFRRYLAADLNPKPYISATVRMITVLVLCLVLVKSQDILDVRGWVNLVAFMAGIFPLALLQWIGHRVAGLFAAVPKFGPALELNRDPLANLVGINIWHEERLMEEGVENIQNLATADLDELIVHTNLYAGTLIDWVDQALLYNQVGDAWQGSKGYLRTVGIQRATDLGCAAPDELAKSMVPIFRAKDKNDDPQSPSLEEAEIRDTVETIQTILKRNPNYLRVKEYWEELRQFSKRSPTPPNDGQVPQAPCE